MSIKPYKIISSISLIIGSVGSLLFQQGQSITNSALVFLSILVFFSGIISLVGEIMYNKR